MWVAQTRRKLWRQRKCVSRATLLTSSWKLLSWRSLKYFSYLFYSVEIIVNHLWARTCFVGSTRVVIQSRKGTSGSGWLQTSPLQDLDPHLPTSERGWRVSLVTSSLFCTWTVYCFNSMRMWHKADTWQPWLKLQEKISVFHVEEWGRTCTIVLKILLL